MLPPTIRHPTRTLDRSAVTGCVAWRRDNGRADRFPSGCGVLEPPIAGIIFNEGQFRVDVFVNPELLTLKDAPIITRLSAPDPRDTGLVSLSGAFGESQSNGRNYNIGLFGKSTHGDGYLDYTISATEEHPGPRVENLSFNRDNGDHHYRMGLFRSRPFALLNSVDIMGARVSSSLNTRLDLEQIAGSPIALFLPRRSIVQIRRDGRLLSSKSYPAGNQLVDSQTLPAGAYEIELTIIDPVGGERSENRFFVKSAELPPVGEDVYHVELGCAWDSDTNTRLMPSCEGNAIAHASFSRRTTGHTALAANVAVSDDRVLFRTTLLSEPFRQLDFTLNYAWKKLQLSARYSFSHLLLSDRRVQLFSPSARMNLGRFRGFNLSLSAEATHTDGATQMHHRQGRQEPQY